MFCLACLTSSAQVGLTNINIGTAPNDGTGDTLRTAGMKINAAWAFFSQYTNGNAQQTPWLTNEDAAGYSLTNVNNLTVTNINANQFNLKTINVTNFFLYGQPATNVADSQIYVLRWSNNAVFPQAMFVSNNGSLWVQQPPPIARKWWPTNGAGIEVAGFISIWEAGDLSLGATPTWTAIGPSNATLYTYGGNSPIVSSTAWGAPIWGASGIGQSAMFFTNGSPFVSATMGYTNASYYATNAVEIVALVIATNVAAAQFGAAYVIGSTNNVIVSTTPIPDFHISSAGTVVINDGAFNSTAAVIYNKPIIYDIQFAGGGVSDNCYTNTVLVNSQSNMGNGGITNGFSVGGVGFVGWVAWVGIRTNIMNSADRRNTYDSLTNWFQSVYPP